ncbi:hexaprenyldihydroxybenzoate methyltransferase [Verticillium alfalfae VaMs.102]|uniref:Hexaprenyldihydroxybenzoate methyltransferase n=1 Tax=Verticillium alfalfae (strain VaMs.102 / ATCC MYA-4576 / FGSC 10136) TaxID=526221 RepID=C9ST42_VERA1|nr:hexaprenyldihydroxybenzoate methyltransferase [Verticillium alfalfae VaMs.102]EEY21957.1 hexaprenyldihydroxybenzoate methyltransferase [Verticillium alfalfae VaMs.102]
MDNTWAVWPCPRPSLFLWLKLRFLVTFFLQHQHGRPSQPHNGHPPGSNSRSAAAAASSPPLSNTTVITRRDNNSPDPRQALVDLLVSQCRGNLPLQRPRCLVVGSPRLLPPLAPHEPATTRLYPRLSGLDRRRAAPLVGRHAPLSRRWLWRGIFAESAARLPTTASVTAIDPSPEVSHRPRPCPRDPALRPPQLTYLPATIETLPMPATPADRFDVVSVFEVVEHVDSPAEFLARCAPFVKPGGWLVGSTIARTWVSWLTTNFLAEDVLGIVPKGTHDWNKYINDAELTAWFAGQSGWASPRIMGVVYVPGVGWREVAGSEKVGNYFFAFRREIAA